MTKRNSNIFTVLSIVLLIKIFLSQITTLDIKFPFPTPHTITSQTNQENIPSLNTTYSGVGV